MSSVSIEGGYYQNLGDSTAIYMPLIYHDYGIHTSYPFIGTDVTVYFPGGQGSDAIQSYYYPKGSQGTITWVDYSDNCNSLGPKPNYRYWSDFTTRHSTLLNGFTNISEETLATLKSRFDSDVSWLWGSLDEGGVFIVKAADNPSNVNSLAYWVGCMFGEMEREPDNPNYSNGQYYYYYALFGGGIRVSLAGMRHIGWFLDGPDAIMSFFVGYTDTWFYGNINDINTGNCATATSDTSWSSGIDPMFTWAEIPTRVWHWDTPGTDGLALSIFEFTLENTKWISGNPFSEDEFGGDPSGTGGNVTGGGYGSPATDTGDVDGESADDLNLLTAINSGLVTLYNPTMAELGAFADFLYTGITDNIEAQLKKLIANPIDYILFVALCKFNPPTNARQEISFAGIGSGVTSQKISNQFMEIDCGSVTYNEDFKSFLDYHSKISIYLPFCGTHEINPDDAIGSRIKVNYLIDLLSGTCLARVKITRQSRSTAPYDSRVNDVIYEYQGNVYLTVPVSATDWRGAYQTLVGLAGGVVGGLASGGIGGATALVSSVASSVTSQKVSVSRSGQAGSSYGYLNNKKPYLIIERPIQSVPTNWGGFEGYMSNVRAKVGTLKGYTEIDPGTIWSDNFGYATQEECQMIKDIMNRGVYL